jgi:hypothetical protein
MWCVYKTESYPVIKLNEILSYETPPVEVEPLLLSEIRQAQKNRSCKISLPCGILKEVISQNGHQGLGSVGGVGKVDQWTLSYS